MRRGAAVLAAACLSACASHPGTGSIGSTPGAGAVAAPSAHADGGATIAEPNPVPGDFRTSMARVGAAPFLSRGHAGGRWTADVYADSAASADALRAEHAGAFAPGARFVEEHFERGDAGAGPVFMMEKRPPGYDPAHGDWRYVAASARGDVVKDGPVESCAGCHGDAPGDHVFRVSAADAGALPP